MNDQTASKLFSNDTKFARFMNTLADVLGVGILWLICSLPIITLGASATAAYYAMAKCVRHSEGRIFQEFFRSFRSNFRQTVLLTILFVLATLTLAVDFVYLWGNESASNDAVFVVLVLVAFVVLALVVYLFPLLSRFNWKTSDLVKTGLIVIFKYFPLTVGIVAVLFLAGIGMYLMPWAVLVIPGVCLYLLTFPMEKVLRALAPAVEEGSEEAGKWYYQ
jgi:uncharacterized membrane protein YesL